MIEVDELIRPGRGCDFDFVAAIASEEQNSGLGTQPRNNWLFRAHAHALVSVFVLH